MELVLVFMKWNVVLQRSKDEEIELVPEDEFFQDAPKEISKPVSNVDFVAEYHRTFLPAVNCILSDGSKGKTAVDWKHSHSQTVKMTSLRSLKWQSTTAVLLVTLHSKTIGYQQDMLLLGLHHSQFLTALLLLYIQYIIFIVL